MRDDTTDDSNQLPFIKDLASGTVFEYEGAKYMRTYPGHHALGTHHAFLLTPHKYHHVGTNVQFAVEERPDAIVDDPAIIGRARTRL